MSISILDQMVVGITLQQEYCGRVAPDHPGSEFERVGQEVEAVLALCALLCAFMSRIPPPLTVNLKVGV